MVNHFHVYLSTPNANLVRFMHSLLTSYSMYRNRIEGTCGHVFQGRYKAVIVEGDKYSNRLSRYIHLNPVQTEQCANLSLKDKQSILRTFKWSSYPAVIGLSKCPTWLKRNGCYRISGSLTDKQSDYANYVEEGLLKDIENPMDRVAAQSILGSDSFIDKIRRQYLTAKNRKNCPQEKSLAAFVELDILVREVSDYYGVKKEKLFVKFQKNNEPRQMLLFLSKKYCRGRYTLAELAKTFNLAADSFGSSVYRFQKQIEQNKDLEKRIRFMEKRIEKVKYRT